MAELFVTSLSHVTSLSCGNFGEFFANYDTSIKFENCVASRRVSAMEALLTRNMALAMDEAAAVGRIQQQGRVESGVRDNSAGTCPGL